MIPVAISKRINEKLGGWCELILGDAKICEIHSSAFWIADSPRGEPVIVSSSDTGGESFITIRP